LRAALTDIGGAIVSSKNPARLGSYYSLWLTGLGAKHSFPRPVTPKLMEHKQHAVIIPTISFVGPAPQSIGLDQVNIYIPPDAVPPTAKINGWNTIYGCPGTRVMATSALTFRFSFPHSVNREPSF
jgi:uncharacterized protein (TIGR03437 family)